ncbi:MAG: zinc transporter ZupT [Rikenellaceae bacterium]
MLTAFLLTTFAGLSTTLGAFIAFGAKKTSTKFLSFSLGLSAGVMIYVSFVEILPEAFHAMVRHYGEGKKAEAMTVLLFFVGIALIGLIDRLIPQEENPHEIRTFEDEEGKAPKKSLIRVGLMTALAIGIHNFPEGIATFMSAIEDPKLGVAIAIALAIHNVPEGMAVAVPVFQATGSKKKALKWAFLSGLAEPVGAGLAYLLLMPFMSGVVLGGIFAVVAGIMVFISLDELLPAAEKWGEHHTSILGVILGMAIMAVSLLLF